MSTSPSANPAEPWPDDPTRIRVTIWTDLEHGVTNRRHPFHQPVLATTTESGDPTARIVVLRHADPETGALHAHTDARAPKVAHVRTTPTAAWLLYDPDRRLQIRASGPTRVLTEGPIVDAAWQATALYSRRCYLAPLAPSAEVESPHPNLPDDLRDTNPDEARSEAGRANFAVVRTEVHTLDWLLLAAKGHTRGRFVRTGDTGGEWSHTYLAP